MSDPRPMALAGGAVVAASAIAALRWEPHARDLREASRLPPWLVTERLAARILLRRLAGEVVGGEAAASPLAARAEGQPYLMTRPDVGISLSHTDGWVAAAVRPGGAVGIDAQVPVPVEDRLLRRCCSPSTLAELSGLPEPVRELEFAWIWSVQEACVKATGAGVKGRPWTIRVEVGQRGGRWRGVRWQALRDAWPIPVSCAQCPELRPKTQPDP